MNPSTAASARNFLAEIFEPDGEPLSVGHIAIWNKASIQTALVEDPASAVSVLERPESQNVSYFGVCTRNRVDMLKRASKEGKPISKLVGDREELTGMPGLWVDIDIEASGHAKASLAPTLKAALDALARAVPLPPTITVKTGGGIHAYWLFSEGVVPFAKPGYANSREDLETLCRSFQAMVRDELQKQGWSDDQTWALPRVMRLPGGQNLSHGNPRNVTWEKTARRYSISELSTVIPADLKLVDIKEVSVHDDRIQFTIRELTTPERDDLLQFIEQVCDMDADFAAVWHRRRRGLPSQSEMDMSIATRLACGDTPAQRVVDALRVHRLDKDPGDTKANRSDYYLATLQRAFAADDANKRRDAALMQSDSVQADEIIGKALVASNDEGDRERGAGLLIKVAEDRGELRLTALAVVNEAFNLEGNNRITEIIRDRSLSGSTEVWRFVFGSGMRAIKGAQLMSCFAARTEVMLATQIIVPAFATKPGKPRQWDPVRKAIWVAATEYVNCSDTDKVMSSMVRFVEETVLSAPGRSHEPFSERWHEAAGRRESGLLWRSKSGADTGVLIRRTAWLDFLKYDPEGVSQKMDDGSNWSRYLETRAVGVDNVPCLGFSKPDGKRGAQRGYLRIHRVFIEEYGSAEVAAALDQRHAEAQSEDS
tara:strand:- start:9647 stop:11611 length:1965 start_codon:yes stop_codon:yes gene_type:complete